MRRDDPTAESEPPGPRRSRASPVAALCGLVLAGGVVIADQLAKAWALHELQESALVFGGGFLQFRLTFNTGAAFSTATSMTEALTFVSSVVSVVLVVVLLRAASVRWALVLGLLLGGALGNLTDRLTRDPGPGRGAVVDFIQVPHWPVFNIADMAVSVGAVAIILLTVTGVAFRRPAGRAAAARER